MTNPEKSFDTWWDSAGEMMVIMMEMSGNPSSQVIKDMMFSAFLNGALAELRDVGVHMFNLDALRLCDGNPATTDARTMEDSRED